MTGADARVAMAVSKIADARGLTLKDLAAELGMPYRTVQNYLTGDVKIPAQFIDKFCRIFAIEADYLLSWGVDIDPDVTAGSLIAVLGDVLSFVDYDGKEFTIDRSKEIANFDGKALELHRASIAAQIASALRRAYSSARISALRAEGRPGVYPIDQGQRVRLDDPHEFLP